LISYAELPEAMRALAAAPPSTSAATALAGAAGSAQ
jgi:hypothetical protein